MAFCGLGCLQRAVGGEFVPVSAKAVVVDLDPLMAAREAEAAPRIDLRSDFGLGARHETRDWNARRCVSKVRLCSLTQAGRIPQT